MRFDTKKKTKETTKTPMSSITIPQEMHTSMVEEWKLEYEQEFGKLDTVVTFTTVQEWVSHYTRILQFWKNKTPEIDLKSPPNLKTICAHAIATNAEQNVWKLIKEKGLTDEVTASINCAL